MAEILPPMMGWSSWNYFRQSIDEDKIMSMTQALKNTGLAEAGYEFVNLDDCWLSSKRDEQGHLQFDLVNFPSGPKLIEKIHQLGLKVGLYSSCGSLTCEDLPASFTHEDLDARTFANWQVDFLKYDYCHVVDLCTDENFLIMAPHVIAIELFNEHSKEIYTLNVADGTLLKGAKLIPKETYTAVVGLGANGGKVYWPCELAAGDYVITVVYEKLRREDRSFLVMNFGQQNAYFYFPSSSGWSQTGREQLRFTLQNNVQQISIFNPITNQRTDAQLRYRVMKDALDKQATVKKIRYEICEHGRNQPWEWAPALADSYRIATDIEANWQSVVASYKKGVEVVPFAKEGSYGNPDMLEVGNGALTFNENRSHFALWAFLCAPLVLGNDVRQLEEQTLANREILQLLKDPYLLKLHKTRPFLPAQFSSCGLLDKGVKYLKTGQAAFFIFNATEETHTAQIDLKELPEKVNGVAFSYDKQTVKEIWRQNFAQHRSVISCQIPPHGIYVFWLE